MQMKTGSPKCMLSSQMFGWKVTQISCCCTGIVEIDLNLCVERETRVHCDVSNKIAQLRKNAIPGGLNQNQYSRTSHSVFVVRAKCPDFNFVQHIHLFQLFFRSLKPLTPLLCRSYQVYVISEIPPLLWNYSIWIKHLNLFLVVLQRTCQTGLFWFDSSRKDFGQNLRGPSCVESLQLIPWRCSLKRISSAYQALAVWQNKQQWWCCDGQVGAVSICRSYWWEIHYFRRRCKIGLADFSIFRNGPNFSYVASSKAREMRSMSWWNIGRR